MSFVNKMVSFGIAAAIVGMPALSAWGDDDVPSADAARPASVSAKKKTATKVSQARGLASLAPRVGPEDGTSKDGSQSAAMLNDVKSSNPRFMRAPSSNSKVRVTGVCHDQDGAVFYSGQRGYSDCVDARGNSSATTSDYFSAYRQAGVGINVSK